MHLDIVLSLSAIADERSMGAPCVRGELANLTDSDSESDYRLEIPDFHTASGKLDEMQNDSDTEDVSHPPVGVRPSGQETIPGTGRPLGEVAGYTELNKGMTDDPWSPFSSENDFNLVSWFVRRKVAKSQIDGYLTECLGGMDSRSFRSAYTLRQHLDILAPLRECLVWAEATLDNSRHATTFYYRNIIDCVRYLIRQVAHSSDMVYTPIREDDSSGERLYSEMHMANWWWDMQA